MTSRIAQTLRGLSLRPSLESDVEASAVTGDGDQTVEVAVEEAQAVPADGAAAPGEDQEVTATVVEVAEGAETESAETVATDSEVAVSTESDTVDADTTTGDGEQVVKADVEEAQETPADGAAAPGEDAEVTATIVEVAEGAETESAETVSQESEEAEAAAAEEGQKEEGEQTAEAGEGEAAETTEAAAATGGDTPGETEDTDLTTTIVEVGERSDLETAETVVTDSEVAAGGTGEVTVSQEGFKGALKAFGKTWGIGLRSFFSLKTGVGTAKAYAALDVEQKREADKLKKKIEVIAGRLAEFREGDRKKAVAEGIKIPDSQIAPLSENELIISVLKGMYIPFYTTYYGHKVESLENELNAKLAELSKLISNVSTESIEDDLGPLLVVSTEGFKGAFKAFGKVWGIALSNIFSDDGVWQDNAKFSQLDVDQKRKAEQLKQKIEILSKRIADYRDGDRAAAVKAGVKIPADQLKDLDDSQIIDAICKGVFIPFYTTYYGHKVESLEKDMNKKLAELASLVGSKVSTESDVSDAEATDTDVPATDPEAEAAEAGVHDAASDIDTPAEPAVEEAGEGEAAAGEEVVAAAEGDAETITVAEAANAAAVAAADGVAQGAAAAAEAAAAAVEAVTGEAAEEEVAEDAAIAEGEAEIEAAEADVDAGEEHAEEYEQAAASLEQLVDALKDAQRTGGMTPQSAQFFNIGFESIGVRLTGKPFTNSHGEACIPSLESFGGSMRRDTATQISMEAAQDWLKKIWEVLKRTYAQVKEWLVKFIKAVFDQSERYTQRANKIKAAAGEAAKSGKTKAKSDKVNIGGSAGKIAVGQNVTTSVPSELLAFVKEAATRGTEGTRALIQLRENFKKLVAKATEGGATGVEDLGIAESGWSGELRSSVFAIADGENFKTKVLPGNVEFVSVNPAKSATGSFMSTFRGWKVEEHKADVEVNGEQKTLSLTEIAGVAGEVIKVIEAAKAAKDSLKEEALSITDIAIPAEASEDGVAAIRGAAMVLGKMIQWQSGSIGKMLKYAVSTSGYYLDYAAASLKQYGAAEPAPAALPAA